MTVTIGLEEQFTTKIIIHNNVTQFGVVSRFSFTHSNQYVINTLLHGYGLAPLYCLCGFMLYLMVEIIVQKKTNCHHRHP